MLNDAKRRAAKAKDCPYRVARSERLTQGRTALASCLYVASLSAFKELAVKLDFAPPVSPACDLYELRWDAAGGSRNRVATGTRLDY